MSLLDIIRAPFSAPYLLVWDFTVSFDFRDEADSGLMHLLEHMYRRDTATTTPELKWRRRRVRSFAPVRALDDAPAEWAPRYIRAASLTTDGLTRRAVAESRIVQRYSHEGKVAVVCCDEDSEAYKTIGWLAGTTQRRDRALAWVRHGSLANVPAVQELPRELEGPANLSGDDVTLLLPRLGQKVIQ